MDIHRADKAYRNRALLLLGFTVLLCGVLLLLLDGWLHQVNAELASSDPYTVRRWLRGLLAGLGLALVKSIVELHGGSAEIQSEESRGTRITLNFPDQNS